MMAFDLFKSALWQKKSSFIEGALASVFINLLGLATAMFSMQVYDRVVPNNGLSTLWVLTGGVFIAIVLELIMRYARSVQIDKTCKEIDLSLSNTFFVRALAIRMDQRPSTVGSFAAQIKLYESVRNFMTSTTLFLMVDVPFALVFVGIIYLIAGPVAIVPLLLIPVAIAAGVMFIKPLAKLSGLNIKEQNQKHGLLIESIDAAESIKSLKAQDHFSNRWDSAEQVIGENELRIKKFTSLSSALTNFIQQLAYVGIVAFGVYEIIEGNLTMGALIAVTIIGGRALNPLASIANVIVQWQQSKMALEGLNQIMLAQSDNENKLGTPMLKPSDVKASMTMSKVAFGYDDQMVSLNIDGLHIDEGERIAVIGNNGSGKSSLLKLLSGLYHAKEGRILLDGVDIAQISPDFLRDTVFYLPQDARLFAGSLKDNLTMGVDVDDDQVLQACKKTGLDKLIAHHPRGLGLMISEGGHGLSGGQRQLVAATRMMLRNPKIYLLDEPTSSMDASSENALTKAIFDNLPKDSTLLMVTHKMSLLSFVDRIIVVDQGRIVLNGQRDAVLAKLGASKNA